MSTTSTFKEFEAFESEFAGKITLIEGPHIKGKPYEMHIAFSAGIDRVIIDRFKSYIGSASGLNLVTTNYDRKPGDITLTMNADVKTSAKAKAIAKHCVERHIKFVTRQTTHNPAMAVYSDLTRGEQLY